MEVMDLCVGQMGKLTLPLLRPDRRNQSLVFFRIIRRMVGYLHNRWSRTVIELRGDRNFCNHEFMDRRHDRWYVRYTAGLSSNTPLLSMVDKLRRRAEKNYRKIAERQERDNDAKRAKGRKDISQERIVVRRYCKLEYKVESWKFSQRVIANKEVSVEGTNIRFVVTKNNMPETVYRGYYWCGETELWIKDQKYFKAYRMSCNSYRANFFLQFLYAAAFVLAHRMKHRIQGNRSGAVHHGQPYQAHHAQYRVYRGEEDLHQSLFIAPSQTPARNSGGTLENGSLRRQYTNGRYDSPPKR